jgi:hypothetical protein
MKKFYYIYEIKKDWTEVFRKKEFSEHSAVQWINEKLQKPKYKDSKFKIQAIYRGHSSHTSEEVL